MFPLPPLPDPARQGPGPGDDQSPLLQPGAAGVGGGRGALHHQVPPQQLSSRPHETSVRESSGISTGIDNIHTCTTLRMNSHLFLRMHMRRV